MVAVSRQAKQAIDWPTAYPVGNSAVAKFELRVE